ncbi:MAG: PQQ-binding-like beta-propeller repeat protein [Verrucomicrobiota bacterium]
MKSYGFIFLVSVLLSIQTFGETSDDWLVWRGPNGNGVASATATPPESWSEELGVKWKVPVPGRGHASPIVSGDLVVVATASDNEQSVIAYDRETGETRWQKVVHVGGIPTKLHRKNTAASATPASDGEFFYTLFHNSGRLFLTAVDREGQTAWQKDTGPFQCDFGFGYGPSPLLHEGKIIVVSEFGDGYIAAFSATDGAEQWRVRRENKTSYSSPVVAFVAGRDQLLLSGAEKVVSHDPASGEILWEVAGSSQATCGTMVWSDDAVFASGGYPNKETIAVRADGSGEILWRNGDKTYEQSLLYHDGHIYTLNDNGIAICWHAETGEEKWKVRLGGPVSSSPILAGGLIYAMNEQGVTFAFRPNPEKFEKVSESRLGEEGFATPVFVGKEVFVRTAVPGAVRQEYLYCVGAP